MSLASYRAAPPRVVACWTSELASGFGTISADCGKSSHWGSSSREDWRNSCGWWPQTNSGALDQLPNECAGSRGRRQGLCLRFASIRPHTVEQNALIRRQQASKSMNQHDAENEQVTKQSRREEHHPPKSIAVQFSRSLVRKLSHTAD